MTTETNAELGASAQADLVQGAKPENLSGGQDQQGSRQPEDKGRQAPPKELTEEEKLKQAQGLADDDEEDDKGKGKSGEEENEEDDPADKAWDGNYVDFEDESANSVVDLLKEANVGAREVNLIFEEAIKADDLTKIKWDVLEEKLGKAKAKLAKIAINDYYTRVYTKNVATTKAVHTEVGGEDNWKKVAKWVRDAETKDPSRKAEFDELRAGIDAGGKLATYAAKQFVELFNADKGNKKGLGNAKIVRGDNPGNAVAAEPLNKSDYNKAIKEAHANRASPAEIAALRARRQAGLAKGWR